MLPPVSSAVVDASRLRDIREQLLGLRRLRGRRFCDEYTAAVDEWLQELFDRALTHAGKDGPTGVVLLAVGGYGRRELCPASDLDLILVHNKVRDVGTIADAL